LSANTEQLEFYLIPPTGDRTTDVNLNDNVALGPRPPRTRDFITGGIPGAGMLPVTGVVQGNCLDQGATTDAPRFGYSITRQFSPLEIPGNRSALYAIAGTVPSPASGTWSVVVNLPISVYPFNRQDLGFTFAIGARWTKQRAGRRNVDRSIVMEGGDLLPTQGHFVSAALTTGSGPASTAATVLPGESVCAMIEDEYAVQRYMVRNATVRLNMTTPPGSAGILRDGAFIPEQQFQLAGFAPDTVRRFEAQGILTNWQNATEGGAIVGQQGYQRIDLGDIVDQTFSDSAGVTITVNGLNSADTTTAFASPSALA